MCTCLSLGSSGISFQYLKGLQEITTLELTILFPFLEIFLFGVVCLLLGKRD